MSGESSRLSFLEKAGYSAGDAAANFVFMTMILFQASFYVEVFGLTPGLAATVLLVSRLWDAFFDPVMGVLADRTRTRWGRFRPWVLWTSIPWAIVMVLAYTTPHFGHAINIVYAFVTNILLMTLYSANNMPYAALGGVMTADINERARLNSFRFVSVNAAQFIVGGFTLPLVAKFAGAAQDRQRGWSLTMSLWAVICLGCFLVTFLTTRERVQPISREKTTPRQDFADLLRNRPWIVMVFMTLVHFAILSLRGTALYNYYHYYADKAALYEWLDKFGLTKPAAAAPALNYLGYIVNPDKSNVADVANSLINMLGTGVTIVVILLSPPLARCFGKKAVAVTGFALASLGSLAFYALKPADFGGMIFLTVFIAVVYAPTIPLIWAIYADVADYSEWKTGRRATGIVFATIGFALKAGLSLGQSSFLWLMQLFYGYNPQQPPGPQTLEGFRMFTGIFVGILFAICTVLLMVYQLDKRLTIQMADELAERRRASLLQTPQPELS